MLLSPRKGKRHCSKVTVIYRRSRSGTESSNPGSINYFFTRVNATARINIPIKIMKGKNTGACQNVR